MTEIMKTMLSRRSVLGAGVAAAGVLAMPAILRAQEKSLKVGVYGGYFKKSFDQHIFPEFTKATGITVESVAEPTGEAWLVQLEQAAKAGQAPADLSMMSQTSSKTSSDETPFTTIMSLRCMMSTSSMLDSKKSSARHTYTASPEMCDDEMRRA